MTVKQLKQLAKEQGYKGYSKLRKAELIALLGVEQDNSTKTVKQLQQICKERGIKGYSKLRKAELIALLEGTPVAPVAKTTKQVKPVVVDLSDEQLIQIAIADQFTSIDHAKSMAKYLCGRATQVDRAKLDGVRLEAIKYLRDYSTSEQEYLRWTHRYIVEAQGVC